MMPSKTILICPLDWGLGHASRCCPLIDGYRALGHRVIVACDGRSFEFFTQRYSELEIIRFRSFSIQYSSGNSLVWGIVRQMPRLLHSIRLEHLELQSILKEFKPDLIISDNRYGVYNTEIKSILITHQLNPMGPKITRPFIRGYIKRLCNKFNELWVPDFEFENKLSGELSHHPKIKIKAKFIGCLSRFAGMEIYRTEKLGIFAMISGPEPHRTSLENILRKRLKQSPGKHVLVCGTPNESQAFQDENILVYPHLADEEILRLIVNSETVIISGGYSGIMDLYSIGRGAYLIPTPGQPEQEYLANFLDKKYGFIKLEQKNIANIKGFEVSKTGVQKCTTEIESFILESLGN